MTCHAELATLRAELAAALARAERAEATLHLQAQALVNLTARLAAPREEAPSPRGRRPPPSAAVTRDGDAVTPVRDVASVTRHAPSVTEAQTAEHRKAQSAARSRAYRLRQGSVTGQRDGVTPYVTQEEEKKKEVTTSPPPSVTLAIVTPVTPTPGRGRLTVTRAAARETRGRTAPSTPVHMPPEVQALRAAWQELVVPHGFAPWPERTSARLVEDALAALERRPLEEWRQVFARVPRSPVCRGDLRSNRKADLLWILQGRCADKYEPADKLLHGAWTLDPEAPAESSPEGRKPEPPAQAPSGDSPAAQAWRQVLASLGGEGLKYALSQLERLRPRALEGKVLVLVAEDRFQRSWAVEHYGALLREHAERRGLAGVRVDVGEGGP